jgi:uncharacterized protein YbjT (DUF2867 family)
VLADAGAEVAVGDLDVPASIDEAMASVTGVVLVSPAVPAQELNVAASRATEDEVKSGRKASAVSTGILAAVLGLLLGTRVGHWRCRLANGELKLRVVVRGF